MASDADAGRTPVEHPPGLVLGDDAGDVVVYDDDFVDEAGPLRGEHADGCRAAADAHPGLGDAVDDRWVAGGDGEAGAAVDAEIDRLAGAEREQGVAGGGALGSGAAGEMGDAAEREHLRAIFRGGDVADRLAAGAHGGGLGAEVAVGVDLHPGAAIGEDRLGDDGDDVGAVDLAADDERRGLVVGVGGAGADAGRETAEGAVPVIAGEGDGGAAGGERAIENDQRVGADDPPVAVHVAVAGAGLAGGDDAANRAGLAAELSGSAHRRFAREIPGKPLV